MVVGSSGASPAMARIPSVPNKLRTRAWVIVSILSFLFGRWPFGPPGFDAADEFSVGKSRRELVAWAELPYAPNQVTLGAQDQSIAAIENGQRRKRVQASCERSGSR